MMTTIELTGIFAVTATTASGRVLDFMGTEDEASDWLDELRRAETVLDVGTHELTEDELDALGPVYDGPCSDGEEGA
jgi:hypothetical protein